MSAKYKVVENLGFYDIVKISNSQILIAGNFTVRSSAIEYCKAANDGKMYKILLDRIRNEWKICRMNNRRVTAMDFSSWSDAKWYISCHLHGVVFQPN